MSISSRATVNRSAAKLAGIALAASAVLIAYSVIGYGDGDLGAFGPFFAGGLALLVGCGLAGAALWLPGTAAPRSWVVSAFVFAAIGVLLGASLFRNSLDPGDGAWSILSALVVLSSVAGLVRGIEGLRRPQPAP